VREGELATGGDEVLAEAGGSGLLVGSGARSLAESLLAKRVARALAAVELASFRPGEWAEAVAPVVGDAAVVVLPGSADGRDLAPRLAGVLGWPLLAGAIRVMANGAAVVRWRGKQIATCEVKGPFVATLLPGSRSAPEQPEDGNLSVPRVGERRQLELSHGGAAAPTVSATDEAAAAVAPGMSPRAARNEAELVELLDTDPAVIDLREAPRIIAGGAGLGGPEEFELLAQVANRLGASVGATRVVTDAGILPHDRQIGTTGVSVRPRCYIAFGISGAAQHVGGLGSPARVISVNLDGSCPMMSMADLAVVADAPAVLRALSARLSGAVVESGR